VGEVKYLNVTLDSKLTWKPHVDKVIQKATVIVWHLRRALEKKLGPKKAMIKPHVMRWL